MTIRHFDDPTTFDGLPVPLHQNRLYPVGTRIIFVKGGADVAQIVTRAAAPQAV